MIETIGSLIHRFSRLTISQNALLFLLLLAACRARLSQTPGITVAVPATLVSPTPLASSSIVTGNVGLGQNPHHLEVSVQEEQITQTKQIDFLLYLPQTYGADPAYRWPLILYLHGSGECGTNLSLLLNQPLPEYLAIQPDFPFIVVSPQVQCLVWQKDSYSDPSGLAWTWSGQWKALRVLLEDLQRSYAVDPKRIYLTGISMGGFGVWQIALQCPDCFAAVVPISGGYIYASDLVPENICDLRSLPVWAFHGEQDVNLSFEQSQVLVDALQECGGEVRFTLYPDLGHNVWERAYADPELIQWLLAQHKP